MASRAGVGLWLGVIVASTVSCARTPPCTRRYVPTGRVQPFLWEVTGPRGGIVLLGTLHSAGEADVPAAAWPLLEHADVFVAEVDEVGGNLRDGSEEWKAAFELPRGQSLMVALDADGFTELQRRVDVERDDLARLKPWVALDLLIRSQYTFPDPNISAALLARARDHRIATEFFDSWAEQVAFLDQTVDVDDLRGALRDYANIGCMLAGQLEAYRAGDDDAFRVGEPGLLDPGPARTGKWSVKIAGYLDAGRRAFVAIGVGNILGPAGIAADLQSRGFLVTRYPAQ